MPDARVKDFLEGGDDFEEPITGKEPITEESLVRMRQLRAQRAERARLSSIPLGTPASQGGTATEFQVTGAGTGVSSNSFGGSRQGRVVRNPAAVAVLDEPDFDVDTSQIQLDTARRSDQGREERANALQGIVDRLDGIEPDTELSDQSRLAQGEAISQNRDIFKRATSFDEDAAAQRFSDESLANSLAIARSAPGAASRESALFNALESLPELQAEGQRLARDEGRERESTALAAAGQLGQIATATRGQDEQRSEAFTQLGLDVASQIANFTGLQLNLDQRDREFLGEVAMATARLNLDVERLGVEESLRQLELELRKQGLDQEWKIFKEGQKVTGRDILGGIFGLAGATITGLSTGAATR